MNINNNSNICNMWSNNNQSNSVRVDVPRMPQYESELSDYENELYSDSESNNSDTEKSNYDSNNELEKCLPKGLLDDENELINNTDNDKVKLVPSNEIDFTNHNIIANNKQENKFEMDTNSQVSNRTTNTIKSAKNNLSYSTQNSFSINPPGKVNRRVGTPVINNWSKQNEATINNMIKSLIKTSFIFDFVYEKNKSTLDKYQVIVLIISSLLTLVSTLNVGSLDGSSDTQTNSEKSYKLGINITTFVLSFTSTIVLGLLRIKNYESYTRTLLSHLKDVDKLYNDLKITMLLPLSMRENAVTFITDKEKEFREINKNTPNILQSDYEIANKEYIEFLNEEKDNFKLSQKMFATDAAMIDIV